MRKLFFIVFFNLILAFSINAQVKVMSYNIKYANENDGENSWSLRKDFLTRQIKFYEPHIFGVQEAVFLQMEHFTENLPNYKYVGVGREDGKTAGEYSAIFYDCTRYKVIMEDTFWLSQSPGKVSVGWDAAMERVCTYALFESKETKEKFWVFNTHFDHVGEQARKESVKLILSKIKELNTSSLPVILMGDLNLEPSHESIKLLAEKMHDSREYAKLVFGPEGTFNAYNFNAPVTRRIDYIFTGKEGIEVLKYAVLSDSWDLKYPSDHLPVFVELQFK
ncbi:endonuclease/exonuclease/phosphatase family protein [Antarcticibacterium arcticum]|uniref:Endonuclease/exonuclease/phosphatase family protein n=1 Tax=Antarcticibacterium arcticum TaxID=2585771 RepID=A0A5B8YM42_9FLAO|nr:endonuclease/exonuclease/phosphatase family protein [Antarcticibacterium arcticum]QED37693.1 endonuclease/exonuclease/phosphatase family protein [Antarcticibacterium arcticum]